MIREEPIGCGPAALAEAKAFMRIDGANEDTVLVATIESACGVCEAFVGQMLIARGVTETLAASGAHRPGSGQAWTRLGRAPVTSVTGVSQAIGGVPVAVAGAGIDIDAHGDGWVRHGGTCVAEGVELVVSYRAGLAADWAGVPAALRAGIVRLAAHLYAQHGAEAACPPAAVAALWRPYRRMPFGRAVDRPGARLRRLGA